MQLTPEINFLSIVVVGNFNPIIITPQWLALKQLIRESESEDARIELIHPDITRFELDWFKFEAQHAKLEFTCTKESHFVSLKDLVLSIFAILKETPITAVGLNHTCHFSLRSVEEYINFGYWLSPVKQFSDVLKDPRLIQITFLETGNPSNEAGTLKVQILPSDVMTDRKSVMFVHNLHFDEGSLKKADWLINLIIQKWDESFDRVRKFNDKIWEIAQF